MKDFWHIAWRGVLIILALTTLLAAGELAFRPESDVRSSAATLAAITAAGLLLIQHLYFSGRARVERYRKIAEESAAEVGGYKMQVRSLERDRKSLRHQIETLTAHREVSRAASQHTSFEDFLDEIAGVVHDLAGARNLTVFLADESSTGPVPRAFYTLSRATDICLSITDAGGVMLMNDMDPEDEDECVLDAELLGAKKLNVTPRGAQALVSGTLTYKGADIGLVRLTLNHVDPENLPSISTIGTLMAGELGRVRLDCRNVVESMVHRKPLHSVQSRRMADIACPLSIDSEQIGVVKVSFDLKADDDDASMSLNERARLLSDSAKHIARAIHSERIYEQAIKDQLTGLFNKRYMLSQLEGYFNVASRHDTHLSVILIDIDHFKKVNDTWGHLTGDIILREVSAILLDGVRSCDTPCRYGGEELAVILPEGSLDGSVGLAERLREAIEQKEYISDKGQPLHVTASFGVAKFRPGMRRLEDLISHADAALYESKENGRNRVTSWQPPADAELSEKSKKISVRKSVAK
ncbi:MAG: GGDEF domain-containing protein [Planctomycetes bacterium]|nr:GGDEF domain-containing protein [Planctomycetota bacterium]